MPFYDYQCEKCEKKSEDIYLRMQDVKNFFGRCSCGGKLVRLYGSSCKSWRPFKKFVSNHISREGPVEIDSYATLKREMKKNNMDYLETPMGEPGCEF